MPFRGTPTISNNQTSGLHIMNSITSYDLVVTGLSLTNAQPMHTAVVDADGSQYNDTNPFPVSGSFTPSGTQDSNIIEVGGAAISLGQTTMSASFPITIASDQSAIPVSQSGTWNITNAGTFAVQNTETRPSSATVSAVTMTGSAVTIASSNSSCRSLQVFNNVGVTVYVKHGTAASSIDFTAKLLDQQYYELPYPVYTGAVTANGASGDILVTEA